MRFRCLGSLVLALSLSGCALWPVKNASGPYMPEMKSFVGKTSTTRYHSHADIETFEGTQLVRKKREIVDFTVVNKTTAVHPEDRSFTTIVETVQKDGTVDLNELAFPELNEKIETRVNAHGEILKAGDRPPDSLFFIPLAPLPQKPVEIGDTWPVTHQWLTEPSGVPMLLDLIGVLKGSVPCLQGDTCLDIELDGGVHVMEQAVRQGTKFEGRIWGRLLFALREGEVVWSETRGAETISLGADRVHVLSCMISRLQNKKVVSGEKDDLSCQPSQGSVQRIPAL